MKFAEKIYWTMIAGLAMMMMLVFFLVVGMESQVPQTPPNCEYRP